VSPSGCTSDEALSNNQFRLTSTSAYPWQCGICGTTRITGFEVTIPDHVIQFAIGFNYASSACGHEGWQMAYSTIFRGNGAGWNRGVNLEKWETYTGPTVWSTLGPYLSTDVFGMALYNGKVHYLKNGAVLSESPMVPDVDYWFDYSASHRNSAAGFNVTFVDPLSHWDTLNWFELWDYIPPSM
jgi:hypothetical protein